jgi:mannose-6-phosphate isomerase-like protein (cupin superfamily)
MCYAPINIGQKFAKFTEQWSPKVIAAMNDYQLKLVRLQGEFVWHSHAGTDEVFLVVDGEMSIQFRDGQVDLKAGEMFVVPKGTEHRPFAATECRVMLIEPAGVVNTGDGGDGNGGYTAPNDVWI